MQRICYQCGKKFDTTDKDATICADCIKLYNKVKPSFVPFVDTWKPQKLKSNGILKRNNRAFVLRDIFIFGFISLGLIALTFIILLFKTIIFGV